MSRKKTSKTPGFRPKRLSAGFLPKPVLAAFFLLILCLLLASQGETYSAYRTKEKGEDSARVAAFLFEITPPAPVSDNPVLDFNDPDDMVVYRFDVVNHSEMPVSYRLFIENVPEGFCASLSEAEGTLDANGDRKTIRLAIQRDSGSAEGFSIQNIRIGAEVEQKPNRRTEAE